MAYRKIGETLVAKGVLSTAQLESALKAQLILGGHLGTILLEMGFVNEEVLGQALAECSGAPYAPPDLLDNVPEAVIRSVSPRLVEEFQLVPLSIKDRNLHVAMVNPHNCNALDALRFALNLKVVPWIAPEVRIMQAMERYYAIPRRLRFIANSGVAETRDPEPTAALVADPAARPVGPSLSEDTGDLFGEEFGYGRNWTEIAESLDEPAEPEPADQRPGGSEARGEAAGDGSGSVRGLNAEREPAAPRGRKPAPRAGSLAQLSEALCRANYRPEAAEALIRFAAGSMPRCLLMGVRGESATAWSSHGFAPPANWSFPVSSDGILRLLEGETSFRGPLPRNDRFLPFYRSLRAEPPAELLIVPIHVNDRLLAIFYGDGGEGGTLQPSGEALLGIRMFAMSLSLLLMKRRIRQVEELAREAQPFRKQPGQRD